MREDGQPAFRFDGENIAVQLAISAEPFKVEIAFEVFGHAVQQAARFRMVFSPCFQAAVNALEAIRKLIQTNFNRATRSGIIIESAKRFAVLFQCGGQGAKLFDARALADADAIKSAMIMNCPFFRWLPCAAGRGRRGQHGVDLVLHFVCVTG